MFTVQNGKALFTPVKTGIAGEKYFEILSGQKKATCHHRTVPRSASSRTARPSSRRRAARADRRPEAVNQFFEAAAIALSAIWTNKLRSFLTVLGNIVAVTSIIAVVSLVQGMNAYVSDAILSDVGADNFTIQRVGVTRTQEEEERARNNPRMTLDDATAVRKFSDNIAAVAAQAARDARSRTRTSRRQRAGPGRVARVHQLLAGSTRNRGGHQPGGSRRVRLLTVLGWQTADRLFGPVDPIDKVIKIGALHFRVIGVSEKKGSVFGQSQDEFAIISLGVFQKMFGQRPGLEIIVKPRTPEVLRAAMDDATVALRIQRRLRAANDNFGMFTSDTILGIYEQATRGIFASYRRRLAVAGGRRDRDHEHHADGRQRAHARNRPAEGARRAPPRHRLADPHRVGDAVDLRRPGRHAAGIRARALISKLSPLPASVQPWAVAMGIGITAVVGLFFGMYPAMRAASLDPIEALRRE